MPPLGPAWRLALATFIATTVLVGPAVGGAPASSLRPAPRVAGPLAAPPVALVSAPRPRWRMVPPRSRTDADRTGGAATTGALCGDPTLRGSPLPEIEGQIPGCGVAQPIRLTGAAGIILSQPATIDCKTARTLSSWLREAVRPAIGQRGGGVIGVRVIAHYACRTRNSRPGAKISEHAKGHAIDIAAFQLADGGEIAVLDDWGARRTGRILRRLHDAACGPFGTVLGPGADHFHRDHFHLDTARYRAGSYCR